MPLACARPMSLSHITLSSHVTLSRITRAAAPPLTVRSSPRCSDAMPAAYAQTQFEMFASAVGCGRRGAAARVEAGVEAGVEAEEAEKNVVECLLHTSWGTLRNVRTPRASRSSLCASHCTANDTFTHCTHCTPHALYALHAHAVSSSPLLTLPHVSSSFLYSTPSPSAPLNPRQASLAATPLWFAQQWAPVVDGASLRHEPFYAVAHTPASVPLIVGYNTDERQMLPQRKPPHPAHWHCTCHRHYHRQPHIT
eukprot:7358906-Prymnesium_polylepis.1